MEIIWMVTKLGQGIGRMEEKVQGLRSINGRQKIDGEVEILWEMEEPKNLYACPMDMN